MSGLIVLVNWHQIIEERSYEMHQVVASVLRQDPAKLQLVADWIERRLSDSAYSDDSKDALHEWLNLIKQQGLAGVIAILDDRGEEASRMRHSTPFAVIMPQDKRMEILARYEALRPRTHSASV